jgi:HKD family nuclease
VAQPNLHSALDVITNILGSGPLSDIDVAAAYVTTGGARDLLDTLQSGLAAAWPTVRKRWLISFDYCRTEPVAVEMLRSAPNSTVKIHDASRVIRQGCTPMVPFHPKAFIFRNTNRHAVLAGSHNVSRSGLNTGYEAGLMLEWRLPAGGEDKAAKAAIDSIQTWYNSAWTSASPLSPALISQYKRIYEAADNLRHPTPTEDDAVPAAPGPKALSATDLQKLRACRHFWIEAGNVTKNLGPSRPGNQLMMKRLSRVFFGVPATNVDKNSPLTTIEISYGGVPKPDCSLTFSDNGMDKLTLPVPGAEGPSTYDQKNLLFTRIRAGVFTVELGTAAQKGQWVKSSKAVQAYFSMPPDGRQWGVF